MAYAGLPPASFTNNLTNVQLIDDISGSFNGSTQTFALTSNSAPFHAVSARSLLVTLGGITQKPQVDYTVDGSNITFTTAPVSGLTFAARNIYGLNYLNNVNDGVITPAKLSTGALTWNTGGTVTVSGDLNVTGSFNSGTQGLFWGDNEPANFGDGNDLKIYHSGVNSFIRDQGTGSLFIEGTDLTLRAADSTTRYLVANETNGDVSLFYGNLVKLATTSTGINVTGTLKVNDIASLDSTTLSLGLEGGANGFINTQESLYVNIDSNNDETGKRFEIRHGATDASGTQLLTVLDSGNVGIGTDNPGYLLELSRYGTADLVLKNTRNTSGGPCDGSFSSLDQYVEIGTITQHPLRLKTGNTPKLTINTDGHVIIGDTTASSWSSPSKALEIASTSNNVTYKNSLFSYGDNFHITNNSYYDTAWKYVNDGFSGVLSLSPTSLIYRTAVSGLADGSITWVNKFVVDESGNVGIGVSGTIGYKLEVNGSFAATTKSFIIPHPSKENYKLRYACLEGPENSVYVRGRTKDNIIELPDYWVDLVHEESITVNLTPIGNKRIWIEEINSNKVYINSEDTIDCFYTVFAERKDVEQLIVEIEEN